MDRRRFLVTTGLSVAGAASLSGCLGILSGGQTPPPRKSSVFTDVEATENGIVLNLPDQPWVQSRADVGSSGSLADPDLAASVAAVSPVGVARAAKGGGAVGATGRGDGGAATAPRSTHGYAKWHGGDGDDYDDWREDNEDAVEKYDATVAAVGVAYLGSNAAYDDNEPGPGKPPGGWDETMTDVEDRRIVYDTQPQEGWYRSGAKLEAASGDHNFGWESVDYLVERSSSGPKVDRVWKISPRL